MDALHQAKVNKKLYRLWFNLNKKTKVQVRTGVGITDKRDIDETLGQGSLGGAIASSLNLSLGFKDYFASSQDEICYGRVRIESLIFQDDVARCSTSRDRAQNGNIRIETIMKSKQLDVHPDKTCYLLTTGKENYNKIQQEIVDNPLMYDNFVVKNKKQQKYLGDIIHEDGPAASHFATVVERRGRTTAAIFELKSVLEDIRLEAAGGLIAGLDIFEMAIIPMLLNNTGAWSDMDEKTLKELEKLQTLFLTVLLAVPASVAGPALLWDTSTLSMKNRIDKRKLNLAYHIRLLDDNSLAKQVMDEQVQKHWPGLAREVEIGY